MIVTLKAKEVIEVNDVPVNFDLLKKEDAYSIATALLYSLKDIPRYSTTSELFYILDYDNFIRMIKYFGGQEIRIPTSDEIGQMLKVLLVYQYYEVEELPWQTSLHKAEISIEESSAYRARLTHLKKLLSQQEIGGRDYK